MPLTALLGLVRKDLQLFFGDRRAVIMSFVAPIAIASFFGTLFPGPGPGTPSRIGVHVVDEDGGGVARAVVAGLRGEASLAVTVASAGEARAAVRRGKSAVGVVIPHGFGVEAAQAFFTAQEQPRLELWYDPSHAAELAVVRGILTEHVMRAVSAEVFSRDTAPTLVDDALRRLGTRGMPDDDARALRDLLTSVRTYYQRAPVSGGTTSRRAPGFSMPYRVTATPLTAHAGQPYNGYAHSFAGMGVQFLFFAAIDLGIGILFERQRGLWKRVRSAPISRLTLLAGKAASGSVTTALILLASFGFARLVFGVRIEGSPLGFATIVLACALMSSTFGLLIAAVGGTPATTRGIAVIVVLLMVMLGGAWVPTFLFPAWLQSIAVVVPAHWAVDGLDAMTWRGLGLGAAVVPSLVLLGFGLAFGVLAVWRFGWEEL